ncbi:MAG: hypothetical protein ACO1SV_27585 [Fimbriimonas sp.]
MANEFNASVAAIGGLITVAVGVYTAWIGARQKGRDQHLAVAIATWDNLQEDIRNLRLDLTQERERSERLRAALDHALEQATAMRIAHDEAIKAEIQRQQQIRHAFAANERRSRIQLLRLRSWVLKRIPDADFAFLDRPLGEDELLGD